MMAEASLLVADALETHPPAQLEVAADEGEDQHHAEGADRERPDVEELLDHGWPVWGSKVLGLAWDRGSRSPGWRAQW